MKPPSCKTCPLECAGDDFLTPDGSGEYGVLLVGEASGEEEALSSLPFQGKAGQVLDRLISRTKDPDTGLPLQRSKFKIANAYFCRPIENSLDFPGAEDAMDHCRPNLDKVIQEMRPKVILAMGATALYRLTGLGRFRKQGIEHWRGSLLESPYGWVVPTFHPSYIMRGNFHLAQTFISDLLRALRVSRRGVPQKTLDYILYPTPQRFKDFIEGWRSAGRPPLAFDIETPYSPGEEEDALEEIHLEETSSYQILRISFAWREGEAITMAWIPPFIQLALDLLSEAPELTVWNEPFDVPRLTAAGANFTGRIYDAMLMWHRLYPPLPYNLQFATSVLWDDSYKAWKHLGSTDPEWYSCHDSGTLLRAFSYSKQKLQEEGGLEGFVRHFSEIGRITRKISKRGIGVNQINRLAAREKFALQSEEIKRTLQDLIPLELKPKKVFKISKERLEEKYGPLEEPKWVVVSETLSQKELERIEKKRVKSEEQSRVKEEKALLKAAKAAERLAKKALQSSKSPKRKKKENPSGESAQGALLDIRLGS